MDNSIYDDAKRILAAEEVSTIMHKAEVLEPVRQLPDEVDIEK